MGLPRSRDFHLLLIGQTTSQFGNQVSAVAIPLLAVLALHAGALALGVINAASTIAFAVIGLPVGAWMDRWRRRPVLVSADVVRGLALGTIPVAWAFGGLSMVQLAVVSLVVGCARVFFDVGYQSYLPTVVGKQGLLAGNSAMETIRAGGQFVGPGVGGWLVGLLGAALVVGVQAATFAVSACSLLAIRRREEEPALSPDQPGLGGQIGAGLRFVRGNSLLRATALTSAAGNLAFALASAVTVIFLARDLRLSAGVIGEVLAVGALAAMTGAALTPGLARRVGSARVIWLPLAVTGPFAVLPVFARPGWSSILAVAGMAVGEFGQIVYAISNVSLRQRCCPEVLLGRVNATMRFLIMGLFPLGAVLGGALGELIGARWTLLVCFAILTLSPAPTWWTLRQLRDVEELPAWSPPHRIQTQLPA